MTGIHFCASGENHAHPTRSALNIRALGFHSSFVIRHSSFRQLVCLTFALVLTVSLSYGQRAPRIGYVYPAGGQQGTSFEVDFGGQGLEEPTGVVFSGEGLSAQILGHDKPLSAVAAGDMRDKLREMQGKIREARNAEGFKPDQMLPTIRSVMREASITEKDLRLLAEYDRRRNDPKQQQNTQIGEVVHVKITVAEAAAPGVRYARLRTAGGLSNPMRFVVGPHVEVNEAEPPPEFDFERYSSGAPQKKKKGADAIVTAPFTPPATVNGRILPGEVDRFSFHAKKGDQLVLAVQARNLIPYLADAVPGWFQAVATLFDTAGNELAFAGGYRFDPDPVVFYKIPKDGEYRLEVRDSIYRGREDFVYRITVGQLPFVTGIFPLGAKTGSTVDLTFQGGNLGDQFKQRYTAPEQEGITLLQARNGPWRSNFIPFQIDTIAEQPEREGNNTPGSANEFKAPAIVNGRIEAPGDADYYRIHARGSRPTVFEVFARRLSSPLDSSIVVYDLDGKQIGSNDDHEDLAAGLTTHHADSRVMVTMPNTGTCIVKVTDTQNQGSIGHNYRLKVMTAKPRFALRVTPSSLNARAGAAARLTVHALRLDGFDGAISLQLKDAPSGYELKGASIPAGKDNADISLTVPSTPTEEPVPISIHGTAEVEGETVEADAVPAEDMMQAFIYRHLVPVDALLLDVRNAPPPEKTAP